MSLHVANYGDEMMVEIEDADGTVIWDKGLIFENEVNYDLYVDVALTSGVTYTLVCIDDYGDAWHGGYVMIDGVKYCETFDDDAANSAEQRETFTIA